MGALECDHVFFTHPRVDWHLLVAVRGDPTPCRITILTKSPAGVLTSDVHFSNWNLSATVPAGSDPDATDV